VIQIFFDSPLEGYILKNPSYIFANPSEQAIVTLDNDYILQNHLRCAAEELPLEEKDEEWFGAGYIDAVKALIKEGSLYLVSDFAGMRRETFRQGKKYAYTGKSAAHKFNLSSFEDGEVKLIHGEEVLEVLSRRQAIMESHPGAIYLHQAEPYRVKQFDLDDGVITVEPAEKNLYTTALSRTDIMIKKVTYVKKTQSVQSLFRPGVRN
jgi:DEAD/DEAH box helicase domain-containing protein